jgi:hypothetical protein
MTSWAALQEAEELSQHGTETAPEAVAAGRAPMTRSRRPDRDTH